jgi:hypothetical protein
MTAVPGETPEDVDRETAPLPTGLLAALVVTLFMGSYGASYAWARLSHRLVFNGHAITGPHASRAPPGLTTWEVVFLPLSTLEATTRRALGWTGGVC